MLSSQQQQWYNNTSSMYINNNYTMVNNNINIVNPEINDQESAEINKLPGEILVEFINNPSIMFPQIFELIVDILLDKSFTNDISSMRSEILEILPELNKQLILANMQTRTFKICLDMTRTTKINRAQEHRLIYEAAFTILMYLHIVRGTDMYGLPDMQFYTNYDEFLLVYGHLKEFQATVISEIEQKKLVLFANFMKVALMLMSKPKKAHLLDLITRITEGKLAKYITGSGQTNHTARRVHVFQIESGTKPLPRPPRKNETGMQIPSLFIGKKRNINDFDLNSSRSNLKKQMDSALLTQLQLSDPYFLQQQNIQQQFQQYQLQQQQQQFLQKQPKEKVMEDDVVFEASEILSSLSALAAATQASKSATLQNPESLHHHKDDLGDSADKSQNIGHVQFLPIAPHRGYIPSNNGYQMGSNPTKKYPPVYTHMHPMNQGIQQIPTPSSILSNGPISHPYAPNQIPNQPFLIDSSNSSRHPHPYFMNGQSIDQRVNQFVEMNPAQHTSSMFPFTNQHHRYSSSDGNVPKTANGSS